ASSPIRHVDSGWALYPLPPPFHRRCRACPSFSTIAFTAASDASHTPRGCGAVGYVSCPRPAATVTRVKLPVGGGGPNVPSFASSVIASTVSQDGKRDVSARLSTPNHVGGPSTPSSARMFTIGGKYICSSAKRWNSG